MVNNCVICGNPRPDGARADWTACSSNCRNKKTRQHRAIESWYNHMLDCFAEQPEMPDHHYWREVKARLLLRLANEYDEDAWRLLNPDKPYHQQYRLTEAGKAIQTKRGR